jgi:type III secretory pathway component EscS
MDPKTRSVGKGFWIRIALLQLVVVVAVTIGALISLTKCDLHEFQRWGAVVAGLGALYVFLQYGYDITLERLRGRLSDEESGKELGFLGPVARRLLTERNEQQRERWLQVLERRRMIFVAFIALNVFLGEMIHGFGDRLLGVIAWTSSSCAILTLDL